MLTTFAADLVETYLLSVDDRALGFQQIEAIAARLEGEFSFNVDVAVNHMRARQNLLGSLYPFEVHPFAIKKVASAETSPYVTLLTLSPEGLSRKLFDVRAIEKAAMEFEKLVTIAIRGLSGAGSESIRFGWPSEIGRPMEFPEAMSWLSNLMGIRLGRGFRPPRRKDGGVDIISWRKFQDGKSAFPIFLVQCTIQSDLLKKADDIDLRNWAYWLDFSRDPQPILAVPHEISGQDETWNELGLKSLVLDRPRILELLRDASNAGHIYENDNSQLLAKVRAFIESR